MAKMINCGIDWTSDLAYEDSKKATALPLRKGVRRACESDGVQLFQYLKTSAKFFMKDWAKKYGSKLYDNREGYAGDAWLRTLDMSWISDWYKDAYNQRPHFMYELFAMMVGLPTNADTTFTWTYHSLEEYVEDAKINRLELVNM